MKNKLMAAITVFMLAIPTILGFSDSMTPGSISNILADIRKEQGLKSSESIRVEKVSPAKMQELGDSVMEVMIGNTELHDQMDINLGGDGSASLNAFHQRLGYNYLSGYPLGMMNLMSGGMMGINYNNSNLIRGGRSMMGGYFPGMMGGFGFGGMLMGLFSLILIIAAVLLVIKAISRKSGTGETPLDILKKRYAKGEITKEDFEKMKKDMNS